jgi:hypothetical protein
MVAIRKIERLNVANTAVRFYKKCVTNLLFTLLSATQKSNRKSHHERRKSGSPLSHKPSQSVPCDPIFRPAIGGRQANALSVISNIASCLFVEPFWRI